ncbi:HisA/HisF-related TIM barrel protein [Aurantimonas sp. MSK8Z-1]|uniref:HisA/HisF-related TIM barrel protein n=1 Tax=Mangrovibrevibacter kandeliae TaxID=2968473 RepID=UPI00211893DC|nr:HisA/HisF-related TIM barrel protein [Aurantimonas sp. MSK8Z-1]MCW4115593.1 HisA/HisF-related TIM barrel protein [Aurantimonas sp. MSK8Z-1]
MQIIPVLDLKGGVVVRGQAGDRTNYRPIQTLLSASPEPVAVARGLAGLHPFDRFYIADLDRIEGRGDNNHALAALRAAMPDVELWLDAGFAGAAEGRVALAEPQVTPVFGSETLAGVEELEALAGEPRVVLSLDFGAEGFRGPAALLDRPDLWPRRLIVMTLARVGSDAGPDLERLRWVLDRAEGRNVYAAGGVRGADDVDRLEAIGAEGVLVASVLHRGGLPAPDLDRWAAAGGLRGGV